MKDSFLCLVVCSAATILFIIINIILQENWDWRAYNSKDCKQLQWKTPSYDVVDDVRGLEVDSFRYTSVERSDITYPPHTSHQLYNQQKKLLLVYNHNPEFQGGKYKFTFKKCDYSACAMTSDVEKADLVMINGVYIKGNVSLPPKYPGQIWLLYAGEPPMTLSYGENRLDLIDKFNWTQTKHPDSTFWTLYRNLALKKTLPKRDYKSIYRQKMYDVAWFVSHCETRSLREEYVRRMTSEIDVHIYGACGHLSCGSKNFHIDNKTGNCLSMLSENYKFYLSFENTLCKGYITEKFFNMFNGPGVDVIPVVRNGVDNRQMYPPGISIISSDFSSPESLGKYLYSLARDEERYIELLKNKDRYTSIKPPKATNFQCDLCKALHLRQPVNVYHNIVDWLHRPDMCWTPNDLS